ncbi:splicing factor 3B subunit [Gregarina niphandrodes]|uniref:Splicing factor 3B subunit n=1 Tax=Gregarina niphandrodes TaxID=110365 RepID=A0A023B0Z4_GRENI|nr:splicing factor 3B subunit [Gregarina niphandrodes]EZG46184.1 splicing factor 3B subunit [Gregarina niphandrodes]|eukprot:XP_011132345.1 splicing factor 3B subunit [Gregarina niphandrodes]
MSSVQEEIPEEFAAIFKRFGELEEREIRRCAEEDVRARKEDNIPAQPEVDKPVKKDEFRKISRKQLKQLLRPDIATLKLQAPRPEVVESWDVTAPNPRLLVWLKAYRNTVQVPIHWSLKSRYLSGKRAIEKIPYKLPAYMEATKIGEIRAAILEKEAQKSLKQKQREKVRPKAHRMHIDFQVLHDAFFKYAEKPELSVFADVYYEGKEHEDKARQFKPGQLSAALKEALGMVIPTQPPPWLFMMQRYGRPPSYPNLKIPGVNAPLPPGCQWGVNGWGKAPTDHFGNPLYPGVFAEQPAQLPLNDDKPPQFWGEVIPAESDAESDYQEQEENPPS